MSEEVETFAFQAEINRAHHSPASPNPTMSREPVSARIPQSRS